MIMSPSNLVTMAIIFPNNSTMGKAGKKCQISYLIIYRDQGKERKYQLNLLVCTYV